MRKFENFSFRGRTYMFLTWRQGNACAIDLITNRLVYLSGVPGAKIRLSNQNVERGESRVDAERCTRLMEERKSRRANARQGCRVTNEQKQIRADAGKLIDLRSRLEEQKRAEAERLVELRSRLREKQLKEIERLRAEAEQLFVSIPAIRAFLEAVILERLVKEQKQDEISDLGEPMQ